MSILDEIRDATRTIGGICSVGTLLASLSAEDRADLESVMPDTIAFPSRAIQRVLLARGHKIAEETIRRHRRGDCKCPSATS